MSKNVDRAQVFHTTRVRTSLKQDGSWIQRATTTDEEVDKPRPTSAVINPLAVRQSSYVLKTAKKFDSVASPDSPQFETMDSPWSMSKSADDADSEVIPPQADAPPKESSAATAEDANLQALTDVVMQSGFGESPGNPEEIPLVEPSEQSVVGTSTEKREESDNTHADQLNTEPNEGCVKVSPDANAEDPVEESSTEGTTGPSQQTPQAAAEFEDKLEDQSTEDAEVALATEPEPVNNSDTQDIEMKSIIQPVEENGDLLPPGKEPAADQPAEEIPQPVTEDAAKSPVETNGLTDTAPTVESAVQDMAVVEPVTELLEQSTAESTPQQSETTVESVEPIPESATQMEPVSETGAGNVTEGEIQPAHEAVVEQNAEPSLDTSANHMNEPADKVACGAVTEPSVVEAVGSQPAESAVEQSEMRNVAAPAAEAIAEAAAEQVEDAEAPCSEGTGENQQVAGKGAEFISDVIEKSVMDLQTNRGLSATRVGQAVCSYCDKIIDGNVKITINDPPICCHPECLKCGVCSRGLGDMLTAMFLHGTVIHCESCLGKTL